MLREPEEGKHCGHPASVQMNEDLQSILEDTEEAECQSPSSHREKGAKPENGLESPAAGKSQNKRLDEANSKEMDHDSFRN